MTKFQYSIYLDTTDGGDARLGQVVLDGEHYDGSYEQEALALVRQQMEFDELTGMLTVMGTMLPRASVKRFRAALDTKSRAED